MTAAVVELDLTIWAARVRPFFREAISDSPRLYSALNNFHPALALVDAPAQPRWCAVRSAWYGRTYLGGEIPAELLGPLVERLRGQGQVFLDLADPCAAHFPPGATEIERRIKFYKRDPADPAIHALAAGIPHGLHVVPVKRSTLCHCRWRDYLLAVYGTATAFLARSVGFVLVDGAQILAEAHAFFWGDTLVEIGAITAEAQRGRGYATMVAAHLVLACEERGYGTYWGCHAANDASAAVARKLGYRVEEPYALAYYPALDEDAG